MSQKVSYAERLRQALALRDMKQSELCELTNIPKSAMSQYVNGSFEPKQDRVELMAKVLNVNEAWLMGYHVPMDRSIGYGAGAGYRKNLQELMLDGLTPEQAHDPDFLENWQKYKQVKNLSNQALQTAALFDTLDEHGKRIINMLIDEELSRIGTNRNKILKLNLNDYVCLRRIFGVTLSSTSGQPWNYLVEECQFDNITVQKNSLTQKANMVFVLHGNDLMPNYCDGDLLLIHEQEELENNDLGIFIANNKIYLLQKRNDNLFFASPIDSDNIDTEQKYRYIGKVIGVLEPEWIAE